MKFIKEVLTAIGLTITWGLYVVVDWLLAYLNKVFRGV